jgi:TRAP-type uncharacterized transport system substrate-binding protein
VLSLSDEQIAETKRSKLVIPAGPMPGRTPTSSPPRCRWSPITTTAMDDDAAYQLTKTFWEQKAAMAEDAPWWNGVDAALMANINGKIHPGAVRYYTEAGIELTAAQQ